jgi:cytoskeletal protein RodZ
VKRILVTIVLLVLGFVMAVTVFGDDKNQGNTQTTDQAQAAPGTTVAPKWDPARNLSPELQNALSTSQEGLEEQPAPDGGYMVDLQGRFQHLSVLAVNAQGNLVPQCVSPGHDCSKCQTDKHSKDAKSGGEEGLSCLPTSHTR